MPAETTYLPSEERQLREGGYLEGESSTSPGSGAWGGASDSSSVASANLGAADQTIQNTYGPQPVAPLTTDAEGKPNQVDWDLINQDLTQMEKAFGAAAQQQIAEDTSMGTARYFTSVQSKIYINTTVADEIFGVTYQVSCGTTPYYGFASKYFDAVVRGKCEIQGQVLVYYNKLKYFWTLIKQETSGAASTPPLTDEEKQLRETITNDSLSDEQKAKATMDVLNKGKGTKPSDKPPAAKPAPGQAAEAPYGSNTTTKPTTTTAPTAAGLGKLAGGGAFTGATAADTFASSSSNPQAQEKVADTSKKGTRQTTLESAGPYIGGNYGTDETQLSSEDLKKSNDISLQDKLDLARKEKDTAEEQARALAEETEIDYAGPFTMLILTGNQTQDDAKAPLNVSLKECFLTGKSRNYYQDDKLLFTGYSFIARKEVDL